MQWEHVERSKALSHFYAIFCIVTNNEKKNSPLFLHLYYLIFNPSVNTTSKGFRYENDGKIALFSAAIVTMGSLAACQSTTQPPKPEHGMMQDGPREGHHRMKHREFTPEQKLHGNSTAQNVKLALNKFKKHVMVRPMDNP